MLSSRRNVFVEEKEGEEEQQEEEGEEEMCHLCG
jgi:hypothetical protein